MAVSKVLSAGLSPQRPMFHSRPVHLGFVVDEVALGRGHDFFLILRFSLVSIIPPVHHNHASSPLYSIIR